MDKAAFLATLRAGRAAWDALLADLQARAGPERLAAPGAVGPWAVKDVIAHVSWYEREMLGLVRARALAGSELWQVGADERNAAIAAQNRDRPLREVLAEAEASYAALLAAFEQLDDADFIDAARYAGMPAEWAPWDVFAQNTYAHYAQHLPALRAWLAAPA